MTPAYYVVRLPSSRRVTNRTSLIVESRPMHDRRQADGWCSFVQGNHPKDDVFVIHVT